MKKITALSCLLWCIATVVHAQTFMQHIRNAKEGNATLTVIQSKEIDRLVDGGNVAKNDTVNKKRTDTTTPTANKNANGTTSGKQIERDTLKKGHVQQPDSTRKDTTRKNAETPTAPKTERNGEDINIPVLDLRKKVMRRAYKVDGYRVQVLAGGNSRVAKNKVQQAGNAIKMAFPNEPVYVHFYSPRWICRMGNYRTFEEASEVLRKVKKLGYKQAVIVKGKITVQY